MKRVSDKRKERKKVYDLIKELDPAKECCYCGTYTGDWMPRGNAEPHHPYGRNGINYFSIIPLCHDCHEKAHANPKKAEKAGLIIKIRKGEL